MDHDKQQQQLDQRMRSHGFDYSSRGVVPISIRWTGWLKNQGKRTSTERDRGDTVMRDTNGTGGGDGKKGYPPKKPSSSSWWPFVSQNATTADDHIAKSTQSTRISISGVIRFLFAPVSPSLIQAWVQSMFGVTVILYVLNQQHLLPKPLSAVVSQILFWPTLPITLSKRIGHWITVVDDVVVMGGVPLPFTNFAYHLNTQYQVTILKT
jgi:hypothetical protein